MDISNWVERVLSAQEGMRRLYVEKPYRYYICSETDILRTEAREP